MATNKEDLLSSEQLLMATSYFQESTRSLEWKIKNFSLAFRLNENSIQSPPLKFYSSKWAFCLIPFISGKNAYFEIKLVKISSIYVFRVECEVCFKGKNNENIFVQSVAFNQIADSYYVTNVSKATLYKMLYDDALTVCCKLCVIEHFFNEDVESAHQQSTVKKDGSVSTVSKGQESLLKDVEALLGEQKYCDVTLQIGDEKFPAHKLILAARSSVFAAMFEHDMVESLSNNVNITDIEGFVMKDLLQYIYSGKVGVDDDDLSVEKSISLYIAADKYALLELKAHCTRLLQKKVSADNACDILVLADAHNDGMLIDSIKIFARDNTSILSTEKWRRLAQERPYLATDVILTLAAVVSSKP